MKLFLSIDVIVMKKSMLVVILILVKEFIYLNSTIVIHYGVQKHFIIEFIILNENDHAIIRTFFLIYLCLSSIVINQIFLSFFVVVHVVNFMFYI